MDMFEDAVRSLSSCATYMLCPRGKIASMDYMGTGAPENLHWRNKQTKESIFF